MRQLRYAMMMPDLGYDILCIKGNGVLGRFVSVTVCHFLCSVRIIFICVVSWCVERRKRSFVEVLIENQDCGVCAVQPSTKLFFGHVWGVSDLKRH
jgi:hypothetical protein